jgi:hypothetical protein
MTTARSLGIKAWAALLHSPLVSQGKQESRATDCGAGNNFSAALR